MAKFDLSEIKKQPKKNLLEETKPNSTSEPLKKKAKAKRKGKVGRPVKNEVDKLSKKVTVNLTKAEFNKLKELSEKNFDIPIPKLIRSFLKQGNHI